MQTIIKRKPMTVLGQKILVSFNPETSTWRGELTIDNRGTVDFFGEDEADLQLQALLSVQVLYDRLYEKAKNAGDVDEMEALLGEWSDIKGRRRIQ